MCRHAGRKEELENEICMQIVESLVQIKKRLRNILTKIGDPGFLQEEKQM